MGSLRVRRPRRLRLPVVVCHSKAARHELCASSGPQRAGCAGDVVESSHSSCISSVLLMQAIICDAMLLAECSFSFCSLVLSSTIIRCFHVLGDSRGCMSNMSLRKSESYFLHAHASTSGRLQPARPHEAVSAPIWQLPAVCRHTIHAHTTRDNPRAYNTYKSRAHERAAPARPPHTHRPSLPPAWPPHTHLPPGRWPRRATLAVAARARDRFHLPSGHVRQSRARPMGADARQARAALNRHVVGHLPRAQGRLAVHGEVSRGSDAMRREGRRTADQGRRSARVGAESATYGQNWRTCWPLSPGGPAASRAARNGSTEGRKMDAQEVENFIPRSDIGTFSTRARERALRIIDWSAWANNMYQGR